MKKRWISLLISGALAVNSLGMVPVGAADLDIPLEGDISDKVNEVVIEEEDVVDEAVAVEEDVQEGTVSEIKEVPIDEAHFPEANFRKYLGQFDKDGNGIFSQEEIQQITSIYAPSDYEDGYNYNVNNITGIEYLVNVESIHVENGLDTDSLDLTHNTKLKKLNLESGGSLKHLNISTNSELKQLWLPIGGLDSIQLPENNSIEELYITEAESVKEQIGLFKNLKYLKWDGMYLPNKNTVDVAASLDLAALPKLETLELWSRDFTNLDLSGNKELKTLIVHNLQQDTLDLSGNQKLEIIRVKQPYNSAVFDLDISGNPLLEEVDLYAPNLRNLKFAKTEKLKKLKLESRTSSFDTLDVSLFPELENLQIHSLPLKELNVSELPKLKVLYLKGEIELDTLDLSKNTALKQLSVKSESLGFISADNSTLVSTSVSGQKEVKLDSDGSFDLSKIPGYDASRFEEVSGGKIKGSKLYPTGTSVIYRYRLNDRQKLHIATMTFTFTGVARPQKVTGLQITGRTSTSVKCKWDKMAGIDGYVVYANSKNCGDTAKKRFPLSSKTTSYNIKGLKPGGEYYIIIRAYKKINGKNIYSDYGGEPTKVVFTVPQKPTLKVSGSGSKVKFTWNNKRVAAKNVDSGYLLYYSTKKNSGYKRLALLPETKGSYTATKLKKGKTYYFKMRAYVRNNDKSGATFSAYTTPIKKKI